jgi:DNA-binding FrmR family transcriptional regulator
VHYAKKREYRRRIAKPGPPALDKYPAGVYHITVTDTPAGYNTSEVTAMTSQCCCVKKTKERDEKEIKSLINRLSRIEGQIRGIRGMIEKDAYCTDILTQSAAVGAAIDAFNRELLSSHIRTCVADDIRRGNDETVDELLDILRKLMK